MDEIDKLKSYNKEKEYGFIKAPWKVKYSDNTLSRLSLQIGSKGQAIVYDLKH